MLRRQSRNDSPAGYKEKRRNPLLLPRRGREREEEKKRNLMTTMTLQIPNNDVSMFKLIVERMGWLLQREAEE